MDETDAALDEANSKRYADMIKELGSKSQLIVITHNRATMAVAGELYGVTMGSDGVSKLLSVKLEEAGACGEVDEARLAQLKVKCPRHLGLS